MDPYEIPRDLGLDPYPARETIPSKNPLDLVPTNVSSVYSLNDASGEPAPSNDAFWEPVLSMTLSNDAFWERALSNDASGEPALPPKRRIWRACSLQVHPTSLPTRSKFMQVYRFQCYFKLHVPPPLDRFATLGDFNTPWLQHSGLSVYRICLSFAPCMYISTTKYSTAVWVCTACVWVVHNAWILYDTIPHSDSSVYCIRLTFATCLNLVWRKFIWKKL